MSASEQEIRRVLIVGIPLNKQHVAILQHTQRLSHLFKMRNAIFDVLCKFSERLNFISFSPS